MSREKLTLDKSHGLFQYDVTIFGDLGLAGKGLKEFKNI